MPLFPWRLSPSVFPCSAVELAPLYVDAKLANCHAQILHGQDRPVLAATLPTTSIAGSLNTQRATATLVFTARLVSRLPGDGEAGGSAKTAHRIVCARVARANATVLVCVRGDVGDEFLCREREETGESLVRLRWRGKSSAGHVVVGDGVRDLRRQETGQSKMTRK